MEILQILSSLLGQNNNEQLFSTLVKLLTSNFPELKNLLENLNLQALLPILSNLFSQKEKSPTVSVEQGVGLNPIVNIADKEIVYTLGRYFHEPL